MKIPPTMVPIVKGRDHTEPGGHALAGASESDSNPNKRHAPPAQAQPGTSEETAKETPKSHLIGRSPISSTTQAALLALLSEPSAESPGGNSFAEIVEEATLDQSTTTEHTEAAKDENIPKE